ncbi:MAG: flagellar hook assembly protein FlgD [Burkholderiales bacterium]
MTNVSAAATTQPSALAALGARKSTESNEIEDRFLALLIAQMKNQDPLNPLDNAQVTSQMAQINTVNGIEKLNKTMEKMIGAQNELQSLEAGSLVGRSVLAAGSTLDLATGSTARAAFEIASAADQVTLTVTDASGQAVYQKTLASHAPGLHGFEWDGRTASGAMAQPGRYSFKVEAIASGKPLAAQAFAASRVDAVSAGAGGISLRTSTGEVAWSAVRQVM